MDYIIYNHQAYHIEICPFFNNAAEYLIMGYTIVLLHSSLIVSSIGWFIFCFP